MGRRNSARFPFTMVAIENWVHSGDHNSPGQDKKTVCTILPLIHCYDV